MTNISHLETGSVLDSRDVSYLHDLPIQQKQSRRRNESASDIDHYSTYSDDVKEPSRLCSCSFHFV